MEKDTCVVMACSNMEDRTHLVRTLESLSLDVILCSDMDQVHEVLSGRNVLLLFCDEHLSEGHFREIVGANSFDRKGPRVVVTIRTGEWDTYLQMMRLGAYDVLRCPFCPTDVEFVVLRAREEQRRIGRWIEKVGPGRIELPIRVSKSSL